MAAEVLVLNANFEPIHICNLRRAINLILADKAALVVNGRGEIHSASRSYPMPSVIRLNHMISRPRPVVRLTRREVFRRDSYICQYCGKKTIELTIDHVIPRHMGGQHRWNNVVAACGSCNHRKGGHTQKEAGMRLLKIPHEPPATAVYIFGRHLLNFSEWEPFLKGW